MRNEKILLSESHYRGCTAADQSITPSPHSSAAHAYHAHPDNIAMQNLMFPPTVNCYLLSLDVFSKLLLLATSVNPGPAVDNQGGENRTMQKMYLLSGLWLGACRISALAGDVSSVGVGPALGHSHCPSSQLELGPFFYSPLGPGPGRGSGQHTRV